MQDFDINSSGADARADRASENPPAFPRDERYLGHNGMSLRDWFAGQCVSLCWQQACVMVNTGRVDEENGAKVAAGMAYLVANAMLAERERRS